MDRSNTMVASRSRIFRVTGKTTRPRAPFSLYSALMPGKSRKEEARKKRERERERENEKN